MPNSRHLNFFLRSLPRVLCFCLLHLGPQFILSFAEVCKICVQWVQHHLFFQHIVFDLQRQVNYIYVSLFLVVPFYSSDLFVYSFNITTPLLELHSKFAVRVKIQTLCFSFNLLLANMGLFPLTISLRIRLYIPTK